jgi:tetratricopeptide (TPR) repeat protein
MFPSGMLAMIISLWLVRKRIGRGPLVALLFFAGTLFPALGFADVYPMRYSFVADHFQYLASVGLLALAAAGLSRLPLRITMVLVVALGVLTWRQTEFYRSLETLWRDTLAKNPACWMAQSNLGSVLLAQGNLAEAETHFRAALQLKPDSEDIHYNYGNMLGRAGRPDEAITQFRQALQLNPTDAQAYHDLGIALYQEHRLDEAIACFRRALCYQPDYADAHYNLGNALVLEYKFDEAAREYREALRLEPDSVDIKNRLRALGVPTN